MVKAKQEKRQESSSGFHFINLFQTCPRKFYIRYVKQWQTKTIARPLAFGGAFHVCCEVYYHRKGIKAAINAGLNELQAVRKSMETPEVYETCLRKLPVLFTHWVEAVGARDLVEYKILDVEKELLVPIEGTPYRMTIRPDAVMQSKISGNVIIMEHKTSGFSHRITAEGVQFGDQATTYLWGYQKVTGKKVFAVQPDIAYWNNVSEDISNIKIVRPDLVFRTPYQFTQFESAMAQLFTEVNAKVKALADGYSPEAMFPRCGYYCLSFSHKCEYCDVCGLDLSIVKMPKGLIHRKAELSLGQLSDDTIALTGEW